MSRGLFLYLSLPKRVMLVQRVFQQVKSAVFSRKIQHGLRGLRSFLARVHKHHHLIRSGRVRYYMLIISEKGYLQ